MKILFTGASSFTGCWFARQLARNGHEVHAILRAHPENYHGTRGERVALLANEPGLTLHPKTSFGQPSFTHLLRSHSFWDLFCHHAADVTNYRSPDFNPVQALQNNTDQLEEILLLLKERGCQRLVLTGSVFEGGTGIGTDNERSFSPYGLSKKMTSDIFRFYCERHGFSLGKFVIPNPFGPYEEMRFTHYLMQHWSERKTPVVHVPAYIRDNIHIPLLTRAYVYFVDNLSSQPSYRSYGPNGYVESQGAFSQRFAREISTRLGWNCPLTLLEQTTFPEPRIRINSDSIQWTTTEEEQAWDALASYYAERLTNPRAGVHI